MSNAPESLLWRLQGHAPHKPVHFIAQTQEILSQIAAILPGNTRNEGFLLLHHTLFPATLGFVTTESLQAICVAVRNCGAFCSRASAGLLCACQGYELINPRVNQGISKKDNGPSDSNYRTGRIATSRT